MSQTRLVLDVNVYFGCTRMCFGEEVRVIVLEHRLAGAWKPKKTGPEVQGGSHRGREGGMGLIKEGKET